MNEQLKEIAVKAKVEHCISHVRLEEFAELIVKECIDICNTTMSNGYLNGVAAGVAIRKHFGFEEPAPKLGPGVNYRPTYPDEE